MEAESTNLRITFPFERGLIYEPGERYAFWDHPTTIEWFKKRGYTLYERIKGRKGGISKPVLPFEPSNKANYPCAYYDTDTYDHSDTTPPEPLRAYDPSGKIVFAQDSFNRHVAIKLVRADTEEYRVLRFLNEQRMEALEDNCVISVLELLPIEGYWFAVMPRWGTDVCFPPIWRLSDLVDLMHCMLKEGVEIYHIFSFLRVLQGLAFLHKNNIAHGDIALRNTLVNNFSDDRTMFYSLNRKELQRKRCLSYALFDFDFSIMFPLTADKWDCRLTYYRSWGTFNYTEDTVAGEFDYDPFAMDVACMGLTLYGRYRTSILAFPALFPLFDMMTTWDIPHRFTATQALEFFESHLSELTEDQLEEDFTDLGKVGKDPWETLAPDLARKWQMYKTPPKPQSHRLFCWITSKRCMNHIVPWTRWLCFQTSCAFKFPLRIFRWFFPAKITLD